jgi:hypothetical protein
MPSRTVPHDAAERHGRLFGSWEVPGFRAVWFVLPRDPTGIGGPCLP